MRVLWFTNTPSCYDESHSYNGGGWISSLEKGLRGKVELAICFYFSGGGKKKANGVSYYPLRRPQKTFRYLWELLTGKVVGASEKQEAMTMPSLLEVVEDFKPDVIHVFGSENVFGLLARHTDVPLVLHIQGILNPYLNAFLPPFVSWKMYLSGISGAKALIRNFSEKKTWEKSAATECRMYRSLRYVMGRTEWDKRVSRVLGDQPQYFHCDEILRDVFYEVLPREGKRQGVPLIVTTISSQLYKGYDMLLKTASVLKNNMGLDFEWRVYGDVSSRMAERIAKVRACDVNVRLMGVATPLQLREALHEATCYVHTSYIDNSPNSLCEAQLVGCACVANYVGGIPSLIENGKTGLLVPANDPYQMAYCIYRLASDAAFNEELGENARKVALQRHDREKIVSRVMEIYNQILESDK